jgi:ribonuclease P protein component
VLPKSNRLRAGAEFTRVSKTGHRASSANLVIYAALESNTTPKIGFIVNRSVGGSVTRHRVTRKLRHNFASYLDKLPKNTMLVVRVLKEQRDYQTEVASSITKIISKLTKVDA